MDDFKEIILLGAIWSLVFGIDVYITYKLDKRIIELEKRLEGE